MKALGIAKHTSTTQVFLDTCKAVSSWRPYPADCGGHNGLPCPEPSGYVQFYFDDDIEIFAVPNGVWFDTDRMTPDEREAFEEAVGSHHDHDRL